MKQHNEPTILAFTNDLIVDGAKWALTLRQGASAEDLEALYGAIRQAHDSAEAYGFHFRGAAAQKQGGEGEQGNGGDRVPQGMEGLPGVTIDAIPAAPTGDEIAWKRLVDRLEVKGNAVEMYVANPNLQNYPILRPTLRVVDTILQKRYGKQVDAAYLVKRVEQGMEIVVQWRYSEKTNKEGNPYRDLVDIWTRDDYAASHQDLPYDPDVTPDPEWEDYEDEADRPF